jgi:hypothetical protein
LPWPEEKDHPMNYENNHLQRGYERVSSAGVQASAPVRASSGRLLLSTVKAGLAAAAVLTIFYLPAEYGIDVTGAGNALGLTEMGKIKQQLYAEAASEDAAAATAVPPALAARLDRLDAQVAAISSALSIQPLAGNAAVPEPTPAPAANAESAVAADDTVAAAPAQEPEVALAPTPQENPVAAGSAWRDEVSYELPPGEGIEIKLVMQEGEAARFEWTANGAILNHDTHGDGSGQKISYEKGREVADQTGELVAAFTGNHGWYWRNRTDAPVTLTLRTAGDYKEMKLP